MADRDAAERIGAGDELARFRVLRWLAARRTSLNRARHAVLLRGFSAAFPFALAGAQSAEVALFLGPLASFAALPGIQVAGVAMRRGRAGLSYDWQARCGLRAHRRGRQSPPGLRTGPTGQVIYPRRRGGEFPALTSSRLAANNTRCAHRS